jgi:hypothetical protein
MRAVLLFLLSKLERQVIRLKAFSFSVACLLPSGDSTELPLVAMS